MKNPRLFSFLKRSAEADKEKAIMSLELLSEHPAGIGTTRQQTSTTTRKKQFACSPMRKTGSRCSKSTAPANRNSIALEKLMRHHTFFLTLTLLTAFAVNVTADSPPQWDREQARQYGWIYDDFDVGVEKAKETGKPMLVVLRCPP